MTEQNPRKARMRASQPFYSIGLACLMIGIALNLLARGLDKTASIAMHVAAIALMLAAVGFLITALVRGRKAKDAEPPHDA